jgi:DNA-binding NarL/FixJ family response regulator
MQAAEFIQRFYQLTPKPKAVLIAFLEGAEDEAIAVQLKLSTATVRKHIQNICDHFSIAT